MLRMKNFNIFRVHWKIQYLGGQGVTVRRFKGEGLGKKEGWYFRGVDTPMHTMTAQKMKFSIKDFFSKWPNTQKSADLVTFTEEIFNWKLHFCVAVLLYPPFPYTLNAYQNKLAYIHTRTYATGFRIFLGGKPWY